MSTFIQDSTAQQCKRPDPGKHVNYTQGMILGVDEFVQEFAYLSNRDQWMARDLLGYGTVSGLAVSMDGKNQRVQVSAGSAVSPRGQMIRVPRAQCAGLNDWLAMEEHQAEAGMRLGSPPDGTLPLYVVLSYRCCPTDNVFIPGEPCRSEAELTAPSRLTDDFALELSFDPPDQCEEDALREYIQWLAAHVHAVETQTDPGLDINAFRQAIRDGVHVASPPCPVLQFAPASPPVGFNINTADMCGYLKAAFLLWVTEFRPLWRAHFEEAYSGCDGTTSPGLADKEPEDRVLLARLDVPMKDGKMDGTASVNEDRRPYLLHLRMQQEWMLCKGGQKE